MAFLHRISMTAAAVVFAAKLLAPAPAKAVVVLEYLVLLDIEAAAVGTTGAAYNFTGTCSDCNGTATATLRLLDYTPGQALTLPNLASFSYPGTDLFPGLFLWGPSFTAHVQAGLGATSLSGSLPADLPGPASVTIAGQGFTFTSSLDGIWSIGPTGGNADFGTSGIWNAAAVPEPAAAGLLVPAIVGLLMFARHGRSGSRMTEQE